MIRVVALLDIASDALASATERFARLVIRETAGREQCFTARAGETQEFSMTDTTLAANSCLEILIESRPFSLGHSWGSFGPGIPMQCTRVSTESGAEVRGKLSKGAHTKSSRPSGERPEMERPNGLQ